MIFYLGFYTCTAISVTEWSLLKPNPNLGIDVGLFLEISEPDEGDGQRNGGPNECHVREIQDLHQLPDLGERPLVCLLCRKVHNSISPI